MKLFPRIIVLSALVSLAGGSSALFAAATKAVTGTGRFYARVDGVDLPSLKSWEGGEQVAMVVDDSSSPADVEKKHVANLLCAPLKLVLPLGTPDYPRVVALMNDVLTNRQATHKVELFETDFNHKVISVTEYNETSVIGIELPAYSGATKEAACMTLTLQPGRVQTTTGGGNGSSSFGSQQKAMLASNFKFELGNLPCARVASVSALTVTRELTAGIGDFRTGETPVGKLKVSNLTLQISDADITAWKKWAEAFLGQGQRQDSDELDGRLVQLGPNMRDELCSVKLSHVGLIRLPQSGMANTAGTTRFEVELYLEGASVSEQPGGAPVQNPSNPGTNPTTNNPAATDPNAAKPDPTATAATGATSSDPADKDVRDPREFVRIDGLIRTSYYSSDIESSSEENATYTSKAAIEEVVAKYQSALKDAGWVVSETSEYGNSADFSHYYRIVWTNRVQSAALKFSQAKTGETLLEILVRTQKAGVLSGLMAPLKKSGEGIGTETASTNDLGERDPAEFPRIEQSTRKSSYTSAPGSSTEEDAVYRAKFAIDSVEAFFVFQLDHAGWEQEKRYENGDPLSATHEISSNWSHLNRSVKITLREVEPALTEISITLRTQQPNPAPVTPPKG